MKGKTGGTAVVSAGSSDEDDKKSDDSESAAPQRPVFKAPRPRAGALSFKPQGKATNKKRTEEESDDAPPVFFGIGGGKRGPGYSRVSTG